MSVPIWYNSIFARENDCVENEKNPSYRLAILVIKLVNITFVSLFSFLRYLGLKMRHLFIFCLHLEENGLERAISQNPQGCDGVIQHFLKRHALLSQSYKKVNCSSSSSSRSSSRRRRSSSQAAAAAVLVVVVA